LKNEQHDNFIRTIIRVSGEGTNPDRVSRLCFSKSAFADRQSDLFALFGQVLRCDARQCKVVGGQLRRSQRSQVRRLVHSICLRHHFRFCPATRGLAGFGHLCWHTEVGRIVN